MNYYDMYVVVFKNGDKILLSENLSRIETDILKLMNERKYIMIDNHLIDTDEVLYIKCYTKGVKIDE